MSASPPTVLYWSILQNCAGVFVRVWRCACDLDIIHRLIFITFFPPFELNHYFHFCIFTYLAVIFQAPILSNCICRRPFKRQGTGILWICLFYLLNFLQKYSNFSYLLQLASVARSDGSPTGDQCRDHQPTWTSIYGCFGLNLIHKYSMETVRITFICSKSGITFPINPPLSDMKKKLHKRKIKHFRYMVCDNIYTRRDVL